MNQQKHHEVNFVFEITLYDTKKPTSNTYMMKSNHIGYYSGFCSSLKDNIWANFSKDEERH